MKETNVFVNGRLIGTHPDHDALVAELRKRRRDGKISSQVNISFVDDTNEVIINTDAGRARRPLIVVGKGKPKITQSEIEKIKKRDKESNFRVGKIEEYLNEFLKLKSTDAKQLKADLEKLAIPRLKDLHIHKLIDILPTTTDDVKVVLEGYPITITKSNCELIAKTVKKYAK